MTPKHPMAIAVVAIVAGAYGLDSLLLWGKGERSSPTISEARALVCWVLRHRMSWSFPEVGLALGIDHSSVMNACKRTGLKQEQGYHSPSFILALKALDLEDLHSLLPDIPTLRSLAVTSVATVRPQEDRDNATRVSPPLVLSPSDDTDQDCKKAEDSSPISSGSKEPESKPARAKRNRPRTAAPDQLLPTDKHREIASDRKLDLKLEVERCLNHHRAKGNLMASWNAALTTWLLSPYAQPTESPQLGPRLNGRPEQHVIQHDHLCSGTRTCRATKHDRDCPRWTEGPRV